MSPYNTFLICSLIHAHLRWQMYVSDVFSLQILQIWCFNVLDHITKTVQIFNGKISRRKSLYHGVAESNMGAFPNHLASCDVSHDQLEGSEPRTRTICWCTWNMVFLFILHFCCVWMKFQCVSLCNDSEISQRLDSIVITVACCLECSWEMSMSQTWMMHPSHGILNKSAMCTLQIMSFHLILHTYLTPLSLALCST